ncbi:MAG: UDP-N-acetylmuramoyl-L-alanine--D-glutamate ligase [Acidimicrobiales bacterium]|nr:UDP-N-acetylmuramoyl-L-alanine--D-glutamate ligase [Acidimicrobiales bacterium]
MSAPHPEALALERPVAVVGVGVMGEAVARALVARGHRPILVDDRPGPRHQALQRELGLVVRAAPGAGEAAAWAELLAGVGWFLPTPGLPEHHPAFAAAAAAGLGTISEFDLAAAWDHRPVAAITGTNGKTTVTMMVTAMLERTGRHAAAVGNTDVPLVAALDDRRVEVFVVEASSFRLGHSRHFAPSVGTWLNFAPDHLDVHRDLATYERSKARIWRDQGAGDTAVGNLDDPVVAEHLAGAPGRRIGFTIRTGTAGTAGPVGAYGVADGWLHDEQGEHLVPVAELPRALPHDLANALAALATALAAGADRAAAVEVVRTWQQLPHRVQLVAEGAGLRFYDDSKATTPHATLAALSGFDRVVLIAGGQNKGIDLSGLADGAEHVRAVVAIGAAADEVAAAFANRVPVVAVRTNMDDAVAAAAAQAAPGDAVLLSPACASFDWYRNYGERGDDFARAARAWVGSGR